MRTVNSRQESSAESVSARSGGSSSRWTGKGASASALSVDATIDVMRQRVARLARTLESEVIPRLVEHHRDPTARNRAHPAQSEVDELVLALVADDSQRISRLVDSVQNRGVAVGTIYLELLAPAARILGDRWDQDSVDFATVTIALGRLQRLLRLLSPAFGNEVGHPSHGRRVLLTQSEKELHMFGLAMVAEFFRGDGWDVLGGVSGVGIDAVKWVRRDWFDCVGFSVGNEERLPWVRDTISAVRQASRNSAVVILVGGPVFTRNPGWSEEIGADATTDGQNAPVLAERMMLRRVQEQSGQARTL